MITDQQKQDLAIADYNMTILRFALVAGSHTTVIEQTFIITRALNRIRAGISTLDGKTIKGKLKSAA